MSDRFEPRRGHDLDAGQGEASELGQTEAGSGADAESDPVRLACELVAAQTPNPPGDERAAADVVVRALRASGIDDIRIVGRTPERPNVIARIPGGRNHRTLILSGHLDTKPPGDLDAWRTPPWEPILRDGQLYGLGAADMKGAVAAMVCAAADVARVGAEGDLVLVFTADEEQGSEYGARWLAEQGLLEADAAIIGEPSGMARDWEAIRLVSRGALVFTVRTAGTPMHSSLSDQLDSVNASVEMARLILRLADTTFRHRSHPLAPDGTTINPALTAAGGTGLGVIPGSAAFVSEVRVLPGLSREEVMEDVRHVLERTVEELATPKAVIEVEHWLPACEIEPTHPVVAALARAAAEVLGSAPPFAIFPGGTDAPHFQLVAGIPTVPSFGPGLLTEAHRANESVSLQSLTEAVAIYASTAMDYLNG